jgi:small-conductance mechanosensitive channel
MIAPRLILPLKAAAAILVAAALLAAPWRAAADSTDIAAPPDSTSLLSSDESFPAAKPVPLVIDGEKLAEFRSSVAGLTPEQRAAGAITRIEAIQSDDLSSTVHREPIPEGFALLVGDDMMFAILPADLAPITPRSLEEEAELARQRLEKVLRDRARAWEPAQLFRSALFSLLATALFVAAVVLLFRIRRFALDKLADTGDWKRHIRSAVGDTLHDEFVAAARVATRIIVGASALFLGYVWLTYVLNRFPMTRGLARGSSGFLRDLLRRFGTAFVDALPGIIVATIIFLLARVAARVAGVLFERAERGEFSITGIHPETAGATRRLVVIAIWLFAGITAYPYLPGSNSDVFKGVSVFVGVLVTLGSSGIMGQMMSGFVLVYSRALHDGDYVRVGDVEGYVIEVGPLSTKLVNLKHEEFTIPNSVMVGATIKNYTRLSKTDGAPLTTTLAVGYDAPWRVVHELLESAAARTPGIRKNPEPRVLQKELSDFFVQYELITRLEAPESRFIVLSQLHANIQDVFNERGVQIMVPHFEGQPDQRVIIPPSKWHGGSRTPDA